MHQASLEHLRHENQAKRDVGEAIFLIKVSMPTEKRQEGEFYVHAMAMTKTTREGDGEAWEKQYDPPNFAETD